MVTADERRQAITERRNSSALSRPAPAAAPAAGQAAPTEAELLQQEIDRFGAIQDDLMLTRINDDLEDVNSAIAALAPNIENIRTRGYVFKSYLERKAQTLDKSMERAAAEGGRPLRAPAGQPAGRRPPGAGRLQPAPPRHCRACRRWKARPRPPSATCRGCTMP